MPTCSLGIVLDLSDFHITIEPLQLLQA